MFIRGLWEAYELMISPCEPTRVLHCATQRAQQATRAEFGVRACTVKELPHRELTCMNCVGVFLRDLEIHSESKFMTYGQLKCIHTSKYRIFSVPKYDLFLAFLDASFFYYSLSFKL